MDIIIYQSFDEELKKQKVNFDHRHQTRKASEIPGGVGELRP